MNDDERTAMWIFEYNKTHPLPGRLLPTGTFEMMRAFARKHAEKETARAENNWAEVNKQKARAEAAEAKLAAVTDAARQLLALSGGKVGA